MNETAPQPLLRIDNDGIAILTLNTPRSMNVLSEAMLAALSHSLDEIAGDRSVKAVILRSAGDHFCACTRRVPRAIRPGTVARGGGGGDA